MVHTHSLATAETNITFCPPHTPSSSSVYYMRSFCGRTVLFVAVGGENFVHTQPHSHTEFPYALLMLMPLLLVRQARACLHGNLRDNNNAQRLHRRALADRYANAQNA